MKDSKRPAPTSEELTALEPRDFPADAASQELVGDFRIYQRKGGHRTSTDDVLTAWMAVHLARSPKRYLDLGCGIGSVLLLTAHRLRPMVTIGLEAQTESVLLARRSIAELPSPPSIEIRQGDLRDATQDALSEFDLITGSPPYFPLGTGVLSSDPQRRAARFELRGGVEVYCAAADRLLTDDGAFSLVFPTEGAHRVLSAISGTRLHLRHCADIFMREDRTKPFLTLFGFTRVEGPTASWSFAIRTSTGEITAEYTAARTMLGLR